MRLRLFCLFLIIPLFLAAQTAPLMTVETGSDLSGKLITRCITPGVPSAVDKASHSRPPATDQEILWTDDDATAIANNIAINGMGDYCLAGWYLNYERVSKYATTGSGIPLWEYSIVPNWYLPVASSDDGEVIISLGDIIPMSVWLNGAGPTPSWSYTWPMGYKGYALDVSDDGAYIVAVCQQDGGDMGKLLIFNSSGSTVLWEADFDAANGVNGVEISENNEWILITTYWNWYVFRMSTQALFYTGSNYSQTMGGMDDDAEWIATGDFNGQLHVYQRSGGTYTEQWSNYFGGWVTAVDISQDASTVMGGNFTYSPSYAGEVRGFTIGGTQVFSYDQYGDYISDVALCDDGSVGVASSWGMLDATFGDVFTAFDMDDGSVIFRLLDDIDEPGTIFAAAISDDGAYAFCGGKAVHARTFGNGGQVYAIMLGNPTPHDVEVALTPYGTPITIPANGGNFEFNVALQNNEGNPVDFEVWTMATLPSGSDFGPIIQVAVSAPGNWSANRDRVQYVPANAPAGDYVYHAYVGNYPNSVWDSDEFAFEKLSVAEGGEFVTCWECEGIEFFGENIGENINLSPESFALQQNYPNPFNPATTIDFSLERAGKIELAVFNVKGERAATMVKGFLSAGQYSYEFNAEGLPSGVYFYQLKTEGFSQVKKMLLLK